MASKRIIVGLSEKVRIFSGNGKKKLFRSKIDTGASKSSLDLALADEMGLGPIIKSKIIKSAHGTKLRPVIEAEIEIAGKRLKSEFTLADRTHMKYRVLIGVNVLKHGFLVDPSR
ncbi:ATP-dependent zinc protease [Candidatus Woesearchaeota archaeon]|nr:ATP-dependent zinc protease [Candidatus Woesearchaeota archaeon]